MTKLRTRHLRSRRWVFGSGKRFAAYRQCADRHHDSPSLLINGQRWIFLRRLSNLEVRLTNHTHLIPSFETSGAITPLPNMPSWYVQGQLYFQTTTITKLAHAPPLNPAFQLSRNLLHGFKRNVFTDCQTKHCPFLSPLRVFRYFTLALGYEYIRLMKKCVYSHVGLLLQT